MTEPRDVQEDTARMHVHEPPSYLSTPTGGTTTTDGTILTQSDLDGVYARIGDVSVEPIGVGARVRLIDQSHGWAPASHGQIGTVERIIGDDIYEINVDGVTSGWRCERRCLELIAEPVPPPVPPEIPMGTYVTIVDATHNWGIVSKGMIGIIRDMYVDSQSKQVFRCEVVGVQGRWEGYASCFKVAKTKGVSKDHVLYLFMEAQKNKLMSEIDSKENDMRTAKRSLEYMDKRLKGMREPDLKQFKKIEKRAESIEFVDNVVRMITKPITIEFIDRDGGEYSIPMGQYRVEIPVIPHGTESLTMHKMDGNTYNGYQHPHVNSMGHCCWGSYDETVYGLGDQMDIVGLLHLSLEFLSDCDADGWYVSVLHWYNGDYDGCRSCATYECECEREDWCNDCDESQDNCTCVRCPDSYDRLEDNSFPDSACLNCSQCVANIEAGQWQCAYHGLGSHFNTDFDWYCPPEDISDNNNHRWRTLDANGDMHEHPNVTRRRERTG